ncbi:kinesin-like protein KIF14 [Onychomys torridus]|uniref:kinesin-like protein KIF14 n=1 Tax=Onychomys torridus TaxID=38674 RepID=UPI00167F251E|nr:kinesin-like protein KIF14 [Onychomys torridus]
METRVTGRTPVRPVLARPYPTLVERGVAVLTGCCSDISSMVREAQNKAVQMMEQAVQRVGQLAVLKGSKLCFLENGNRISSAQAFTAALQDGVAAGMRSLLDSGLEKAQALKRDLSRQSAHEEVTKRMKASALALVSSLADIFAEWRLKSFRTQVQEGSRQQGSKMLTLASEFLKLKYCLEKTIEMITSALRGCPSDLHCLRSCTETICSLVHKLHSDFLGPAASAGHGGNKPPDHGELESLARSLLVCFEREERPGLLKPQESCHQNSKEEQCESSGADYSGGVPTRACELYGDTAPAVSSQACTLNRIQWV